MTAMNNYEGRRTAEEAAREPVRLAPRSRRPNGHVLRRERTSLMVMLLTRRITIRCSRPSTRYAGCRQLSLGVRPHGAGSAGIHRRTCSRGRGYRFTCLSGFSDSSEQEGYCQPEIRRANKGSSINQLKQRCVHHLSCCATQRYKETDRCLDGSSQKRRVCKAVGAPTIYRVDSG